MEQDKDLIAQCQQGDKNSFGQLVTPYLNEAYAISFTILNSKEQAEDAVQNAMIEAYKNIMMHKDIRNFRSWFLTLVSSRSIDLVRKNIKDMKQITDIEEYQFDSKETPLTDLLLKEESGILMQHLLNLPSKYRTVIILHYYQDLSIREIAKILEIKEGTVKSRLYKARLVLNQILTKQNQFIKVGE